MTSITLNLGLRSRSSLYGEKPAARETLDSKPQTNCRPKQSVEASNRQPTPVTVRGSSQVRLSPLLEVGIVNATTNASERPHVRYAGQRDFAGVQSKPARFPQGNSIGHPHKPTCKTGSARSVVNRSIQCGRERRPRQRSSRDTGERIPDLCAAVPFAQGVGQIDEPASTRCEKAGTNGYLKTAGENPARRTISNAAGAEIGLFCENKRSGQSPRSLPLSGCTISNESGDEVSLQTGAGPVIGASHVRDDNPPALTLCLVEVTSISTQSAARVVARELRSPEKLSSGAVLAKQPTPTEASA